MLQMDWRGEVCCQQAEDWGTLYLLDAKDAGVQTLARVLACLSENTGQLQQGLETALKKQADKISPRWKSGSCREVGFNKREKQESSQRLDIS